MYVGGTMKKIKLLLTVLTVIVISNMSIAQSSIMMNELYSRGTEADPDWIEIYNSSSSAIDITGYKIYDSGGNAGTKPKKEFPSGTIVPANGFFVIVTDDADASGFGLSSAGEEVWLENASGTVIDNVVFTAMSETQSYGRLPDGGTWQLLSTITRGTSNLLGIDFSAKMNEIYSRGNTENPDWIEIYNSSSSAIDISGYKIYDSGGNAGTKPKKEFPAGTTIPANGFFVIVTDDTSDSGFGLSSSGETVWLENIEGVILDSIAFPAFEETQSYGRYPDGTENWMILDSITRGSANVVVITSPIKMNEIYTRGSTEDPDWIEIYNTSDAQVDLSGYKIYDNGGQAGTKPKKEFPAGTLIPAHGFFVIVTDDSDASGFGMSSSGEQVWLEDANGLVIDDVTFPALETTQSYGRLPDGGEWQILNTITKGSSNSASDINDIELVVSDYKLNQNFPNPFNPVTIISYQLPVDGFVTLKVYDILGNEVKTLVNENRIAGSYTVEFDGRELTSGLYIYRLVTDNYSSIKKMMLLK
jgi:predicted extracellular nuclease